MFKIYKYDTKGKKKTLLEDIKYLNIKQARHWIPIPIIHCPDFTPQIPQYDILHSLRR